ncbi:MAG: hypothetical protein DRG27_00225 [Deltaproteobacteria bacterium]|nr:MAG: hypothetical protein DRG27_00225 [Deltaproteobacteria bacterium]
MSNRVRIRILDNEYIIESDLDRAEIIEIAQFVDEKCREIKESIQGLTEKKIAILAAFEIASEYLRLLKKEITTQKKVQAISYSIDSAIGEDIGE